MFVCVKARGYNRLWWLSSSRLPHIEWINIIRILIYIRLNSRMQCMCTYSHAHTHVFFNCNNNTYCWPAINFTKFQLQRPHFSVFNICKISLVYAVATGHHPQYTAHTHKTISSCQVEKPTLVRAHSNHCLKFNQALDNSLEPNAFVMSWNADDVLYVISLIIINVIDNLEI